ncbi:ABC-2 type transporter [Ignisphaera aggregans DSM 17230]|uniref:ABC-2 type transporter n=1 Tax=Ignisphaera aggregans (strain DSM 17230 / JCM 13409 / AQ1.S1) TaxID=583356 RepID=E0SNU1_IGNAA|nr:ABC-2 type transporter [Ignisphaera aggregans DSM 17230]
MMSIVREIITFAELELRRLRHDPLEIFTRAIQPILWLTIFAEIMGSRMNLPIGVNYATYIAPGVMMQSAVFISLAYGIMLVWERDSGILKRLLTTPLRRIVIVTGRALAGAIRASTQLLIILIIAYAIGAKLCYNPLNILIAFIVLIIGCMGFTALSILIASLLKTRERFMGIINAITMPLFFTSNALYPIDIMPLALKIIAIGNPLTYIVEVLRGLLIYNSSIDILLDLGIVITFTISSIILASIWFRKIIE